MRHRRWLDLAVAAILITWLAWRLVPHGDPIAGTDALIEKFDLTVFREDETLGTPGRIIPEVHKWAGPIRLGLHGAAATYHGLVDGLAAELSRLTGLPVRVVDLTGPEAPNFDVHLIDASGVPSLLVKYGETLAWASRVVGKFNCMGGGWSKARRKTEAYAIIKNNLDEDKIRHCFLEEITQSLGLFADSDIIEPSLYGTGDTHLDELPTNDKILIRSLYDRRIRPGMPREEVMRVVRELIPELVEAVRTRGVEALYQQ